MIVAGIHETYGQLDISNIRARDFLNIYLPNINGDTVFKNIVRIRSTPDSELTEKERQTKRAYALKPKEERIQGEEALHLFFKHMFEKKGG